MRIGLLVTRFPPDVLGGAELQTQQLARELANRGHRVSVFTRRYHQRPYAEQVDGYTIRRRDELPIPGVRMFWDVIPAMWQIARHKPRPEVLLCYQTFNSGLVGVIAQWLLRVPAIVSIRGNREYRLDDSSLNRLLAPVIYRRARRVAVQSARILDDLCAELRRAGHVSLAQTVAAKVDVVPNGVDRVAEDRPLGDKVVYIGRMIRGKGVAHLLDAVGGLPGSRTLLVGDGPDRSRLEVRAEGSAVEFAGRVEPNEIGEYLRQARVLVLPSLIGDGLPNVILEAMAAGVPVVATRTAAIPDVVRDAETGFLVEPGDVEGLRAAIGRLLEDRDLASRLGRGGRNLAANYYWDAVVPKVEQVLHSVAVERRKRVGTQ